MATESAQPIQWRRIGVEAAAIVVSILVAFVVDASWDRRVQGRETESMLEGLSREFSELEDTLSRWTATTRSREAGLSAGLEVMASRSVDRWTTAHLDSVLTALMDITDWDPAGGVLDAVIASGRLEMIEDERLRGELASWDGMVDDVVDNQELMQFFVLGEVIPLLADRRVDVSRAWALYRVGWEWPGGFPSSFDQMASYERFVQSDEIRILMASKYAFVSTSVLDFERAVRKAQLIRELIDAQLGR